MADKTGRALGTLDPVIYFHNRKKSTLTEGGTIIHLPNGHYMLPPVEVGKGTALAKQFFEQKYRHQGYEWCEAGTLRAVEQLQGRLVEQESAILEAQGLRMDNAREASRRQTTSNLRQRMISSDCSAYEREFIQLWLQLDEEKRKKYTQRFTERNMYLFGLEMDSGTRVEDRMGEG